MAPVLRSNVVDVLDELDRLIEEVSAMLNVLEQSKRYPEEQLDVVYIAVATMREVLEVLYRFNEEGVA